MLEEVSALIDKKEKPGNLEKAIELLQELKKAHPEKDIIRGKLSHAYFYKGRFAEEGSREKEDWHARGVEAGNEACTLNPRAVYGNYWKSTNAGMLGVCRGIMSSLRSVDPMRKSMEVVLHENENFFFGGPHRALGRLYHQAPGWPISIGKKSKAAEHLERAVALAPEFMCNRLFLAEFYVDIGKGKKAREHLNWMIHHSINPDHQNEDGAYQQQGRELLKAIS